MEILSTGEKIKRARVYQGITLKELCSDEISISKMSCIENGKIKADSEILHYISKKLDIDYNYLVQDVYEQIEENLNLLRKNEVPLDKIDEFINYSLEYAMDYSYLDLAFELIHRLFNFYVENNKIENIQLLISQYYDLYQKSSNDENTLIYYNDMASFFMKTKEYNEAINYFSKMREIIEENGIKDKKSYVYTCFREGLCYKETNEIQESYNKIISAVKYIDYIEDPKDKGKIYQEFATLNILLNKVETDKYINLARKYQGDDLVEVANSKAENGKYYFAIRDNVKAIDEIREAIDIFPKESEREYVKFLIKCIDTLYCNNEIDLAFSICDTALNLAICFNDLHLIERAYYFKGMLLQKNKRYREAEMYMNLSTDSLFRFANREERYKRYLEMADLYYNLNESKECIKYFTLAMNLEKKL
ncbi:helix-turn-helix domain-containing protein [Clostridium sp.]|uniref:helix-turn-helix domain-containing protein n=1 Tax=Clostridium sp. TaxID=1506 RepID=UPI003BB12ADF